MPDTDTLTETLRAWTRSHDPHVRAAVELLIWHHDGFWLRRADFTSAAIRRGKYESTVDWGAARGFVDAGSVASTSEMAILDFAVALGENRYRLSIMGDSHAQAIADAMRTAVGL